MQKYSLLFKKNQVHKNVTYKKRARLYDQVNIQVFHLSLEMVSLRHVTEQIMNTW